MSEGERKVGLQRITKRSQDHLLQSLDTVPLPETFSPPPAPADLLAPCFHTAKQTTVSGEVHSGLHLRAPDSHGGRPDATVDTGAGESGKSDYGFPLKQTFSKEASTWQSIGQTEVVFD